LNAIELEKVRCSRLLKEEGTEIGGEDRARRKEGYFGNHQSVESKGDEMNAKH